jgi:hypothetical protein
MRFISSPRFFVIKLSHFRYTIGNMSVPWLVPLELFKCAVCILTRPWEGWFGVQFMEEARDFFRNVETCSGTEPRLPFNRYCEWSVRGTAKNGFDYRDVMILPLWLFPLAFVYSFIHTSSEGYTVLSAFQNEVLTFPSDHIYWLSDHLCIFCSCSLWNLYYKEVMWCSYIRYAESSQCG